MKITFLVGLPGSGKTHYGNLLAEDPNVVYIDDISVREDPMREIQLAMGVEHILISDVFLCREEERKKAIRVVRRIAALERFDYEVDWVFFENNPEQCLKNVAYRDKQGDHRAVNGLIRELTKEYKIPQGIVPRTTRHW